MAEYARPELLCETAWLADHLGDPGLRIVDCGMPDAYARAHLPGAMGLPHPYLKGRDDPLHVMSAPEFTELMSRRGIATDDDVVVYDDNASLYAARVWWVFDHFGHRRVRLLNGGFSAWLFEGRLATAEVPRPPWSRYEAAAQDDALYTVGGLRSCVGDPGS